jgi:hypothetical protein
VGAARKLQGAWAGKQARRKVAKQRAEVRAKKENACARKLQGAWRNKCSRRRVAAMKAEAQAKKEDASARMLQCAWKTKQARRKVTAMRAEAQAKKEDASARMLQCAWKVKQSRRKVAALRAEKERLLEEASAGMLQSAWRRKKARRKLGGRRAERLKERDEHSGATRLQSVLRGRQPKRAFTRQSGAARLLQRAVRGRAARSMAEVAGRAVPRAWTITVKSGAGLRAADGGTSDPYCYLTVLEGGNDNGARGKSGGGAGCSSGGVAPRQLFVSKSAVVKKDLAPQWNHTVIVPAADGNVTLAVTVVDWDRFGKNDYLGQGVLRMQEEQGLWKPTVPGGAGGEGGAGGDPLRQMPRRVELELSGPQALQVFQLATERKGMLGGLRKAGGGGGAGAAGAPLEAVELAQSEVPGQGSVTVEVQPHFASTSAAIRVQRQEKKSKWLDEGW